MEVIISEECIEGRGLFIYVNVVVIGFDIQKSSLCKLLNQSVINVRQ